MSNTSRFTTESSTRKFENGYLTVIKAAFSPETFDIAFDLPLILLNLAMVLSFFSVKN